MSIVGGLTPVQKYSSKWESSPIFRVENEQIVATTT